MLFSFACRNGGGGGGRKQVRCYGGEGLNVTELFECCRCDQSTPWEGESVWNESFACHRCDNLAPRRLLSFNHVFVGLQGVQGGHEYALGEHAHWTAVARGWGWWRSWRVVALPYG